MNNNTALQLGSRRYFQGTGVLRELPHEILQYGSRALIITDHTVYPKVKNRVESMLCQAGIAFAVYWFEGSCSPARWDAAVLLGASHSVQVVVGIGGGKVMDTAKITADKLAINVITVPTSAATCACTALLAVKYTDNGGFDGNYWPTNTPAATIADLDIIVNDCPVRYNAAGIVDGLAKWPEISYNINYSTHWGTSTLSKLSHAAAKETMDLFMTSGKQSIEKMKVGIIDEQVENAICGALSVTGLISCLAAGGKQAAVSHCLYGFFCTYFPELNVRFLHGELVGASLAYQTILSSNSHEEAARIGDFIHSLGVPVCLDELGFASTETNMDRLYKYMWDKMPITDIGEQQRIKSYQDILIHGC